MLALWMSIKTKLIKTTYWHNFMLSISHIGCHLSIFFPLDRIRVLNPFREHTYPKLMGTLPSYRKKVTFKTHIPLLTNLRSRAKISKLWDGKKCTKTIVWCTSQIKPRFQGTICPHQSSHFILTQQVTTDYAQFLFQALVSFYQYHKSRLTYPSLILVMLPF